MTIVEIWMKKPGRGFEAKNAYDIAVHAQVYRDPKV